MRHTMLLYFNSSGRLLTLLKTFFGPLVKKNGNGQKYDSIEQKRGNISFVFLSIVVTFFHWPNIFVRWVCLLVLEGPPQTVIGTLKKLPLLTKRENEEKQ